MAVILAIESSCDEMSVAILKDGKELLSHKENREILGELYESLNTFIRKGLMNCQFLQKTKSF